MSRERRIVLTLAASQALFQTGAVLMTTIGGLAGLLLAPSRLLATLPIAMVPLGMALATIPASLLMGRIGRKRGFVLGAVIGTVGGAAATAAMIQENFAMLCLGALLVGAYHGFAQFYRFAAAEAAAPAFRGRAISWVLAGGVVAAVAGPNLGAAAAGLIGSSVYAGSFAVLILLSLGAVWLLASTSFPPPPVDEGDPAPARPLTVIARQPAFLAAVGGACVAFCVMVLVMTATPISMRGHDHSVTAAAMVIQWHVLGMYVPSFFTGWLIRRLGVTRLMLTGIAVLLAHVCIAVSGFTFLYYLSALILLGVGWNFLYIGGSTLLLDTYRASERSKVQAFNDFTVVGVTAASALSAGALHEAIGWQGLNLAAVPLLLAAGALILAAARKKGEAAARA